MTSGKGIPVGAPSRYRDLPRIGVYIRIALTAMPVIGIFFILDVPFFFEWDIFRQQYFGIVLAITYGCVFLLVPPTAKAARDRLPWYDAMLALFGFATGIYIVILYPKLAWDIAIITPDRVLVGTIAVALALEAARRTVGWMIACVGLSSLLYLRFTWLAPGMFAIPGTSWSQAVNYLLIDSNGMLGIALYIGCIVVLAFVLFGNLLFIVGGDQFITNISLTLFGRFRGGPAKIALVASSLFGSISGSAVANVATTGVVTIPLMKKIGYRPHVAAAIEAVASSGGQLTPPVMGATAFVMADYLQIPYSEIVLAAIIPSFLYYIAVFFQVDMEAGKAGLKGLPREKLPRLKDALRQVHLFAVPFGVLLYSLFIKEMAPEKAAIFSGLSVVVLGVSLTPGKRYQFAWILKALYSTGRAMLELVVICAVVGIVIGAIAKSGAGFIISLYLGQIAGGNIYLLLLIVAVASLVLGMGMPTLSVYLLLVTLLAPAMTQLGIDPLAAHFFIMYFGCVSFITPPVCIAAFAAAAMAGASPMRTGLAASRLGIIAYIVPFLFVFFPGLLFKGSFFEIATAIVTGVLGCFSLSASLTGYVFKKLTVIKRVLFALAGLGLLLPIQGDSMVFSSFVNVMGVFLMFLLMFTEWRNKSKTVQHKHMVILNSRGPTLEP